LGAGANTEQLLRKKDASAKEWKQQNKLLAISNLVHISTFGLPIA